MTTTRSIWLRGPTLAMALLMAACTASPPPATPGTSPATTGASAQPVPSAPSEEAVSAQARIAAALEEGRIDYGTSLLYRAYALYDDPQLPDEYLGNVPEEDTALFSEIALAGGRLSDDIRQKLVPYTVRPDDPRSIHARPPGATTDTPAALPAGAVFAQVTNQQAVLCGTDGWAKLASPKGFKVWSQCTGDYANHVRFTYDLLEQLWGPETELMGPPVPDAGTPDAGGDNAIDFYLVDRWQCVARHDVTVGKVACLSAEVTDDRATYGVTNPAEPRAGKEHARTASAFLVLARYYLGKADLSGLYETPATSADATSTYYRGQFACLLAHELFHALSFAHNWEAAWDHWLTESSAEWACWHFAPGARVRPQVNFDEFQSPPVTPPLQDFGAAGYTRWVWHLFRQMEAGSENAVADEWRAVAGKTTNDEWNSALDGQFSFASHFREFALRTLNRDLSPGDPLGPRYTTVDPKLTELRKLHLDRSAVSASSVPIRWTPPPLERLSAAYARFEFADDVRQIRLDLTGLPVGGDVDADALIKLPTGWERRPLTAGQTKFCRDVATEDVSEMYLVLSNHAFLTASQPVAGEVNLEALGAGCASGHGTVTISREKHGTYTSNRNNPVQVDMTDSATITFELKADEFSPGTFTASWASITWSYSLTATEEADGCAIIELGEGGGTFEGQDGPSLLFGWDSPDGTLFGMVLNEGRYMMMAVPPSSVDMPEGDPRGHYQISSTLCGGQVIPGTWLPYLTLAVVSGDIPDGAGTLAGSRQRTLPALNALDLPTVETVTWNIPLDWTPAP